MTTPYEPHNPAWPSHYTQIVATLSAQLLAFRGLSYAHIGSTCIPSLLARPTIDILLIAPSLVLDAVTTALEASGSYTRLNEPSIRGTVFTAGTVDQYAHTLYVCEADSLSARAHLAVSHALRTDTHYREQYAEVKRGMVAALNQVPALDDVDATNARMKTAALQNLVIASAHFTAEELEALFEPADCRWNALSTPRLLLRELELGDVEGMYALESDPANAQFQTWPPWTHAEAQGYIMDGIRGSYCAERSVVELGVVHEGKFVGRVGARVSTLAAEALEAGATETPKLKHIDLWFSFLTSSQGQGLATEAMTSFIAALVQRETVGGAPLEFEIECDPRNTGSRRLALRLGFEKHSLTERAFECKGEWVDSLVFRRVVQCE